MPLSQISWPFMAQAIAALLIAWNLKRKENQKLAEPANVRRICDLHESFVDRLNMEGKKLDLLTSDMIELNKNVAVIIERIEHVKEQIIDNKITVTNQYNNILNKLEK